MSDVILERIAKALESIAAAGSATAVKAPAATTKPAAAAPAAAKPAAAKPAATPAAAGKAAATAAPAAAKPAAAKPAAAAAPTKAPGGKHSSDEVRDIIRKVATNPGLGKQSALDILDTDGGGVTNVTNLKPEHFDAVFDAANALLSAEGGGDEAADDFDPTA